MQAIKKFGIYTESAGGEGPSAQPIPYSEFSIYIICQF